MFPTGDEMKARINNSIASKLNELIETEARFGNINIDMGPTLLTMVNYTSEVEKLLIVHGYDIQTYYTNYKTKRGEHKVISWDNNTVIIDVPDSQLITATRLRKSRMKEVIMQSIADDFSGHGLGTINGIPIKRLCLNEYLYKNRHNLIVQDCINTVCTYGYSYDVATNKFTPI